MLSSDSVKVVIGFVVVFAILACVMGCMKKKDNKTMSRKKMMRQPLLVRNGRVVSPVMMKNSSENFSDQYTANIPIDYGGGKNPIFMNSVPDSDKNPWVGSISSIDM